MIVYFAVVFSLFVAGIGSIVYTLPLVKPLWRPLYFLALAMCAALLIVHLLAFHARYLVGDAVPGVTTALGVFSMSVLSLLLNLVPWVHRVEHRARRRRRMLD